MPKIERDNARRARHAQHQRRYRARRKHGVRVAHVDITRELVLALASRGWLEWGSRHSDRAIQSALYRAVNVALKA